MRRENVGVGVQRTRIGIFRIIKGTALVGLV
jgi:hypothetical protein